MALIAPTGNVLEMKVCGYGPEGESFVNVFHYMLAVAATLTPTELMNIANDMATSFMPSMLPLLTSDWTGDVIRAKTLSNNGGALVEAEVDISAMVGSDTAGTFPYVNCLIFRKHSGMSGRHNRGRCYISPVAAFTFNADGSVVDGILAGAPVTNFQSALIITLASGLHVAKPVVVNTALTNAVVVTSASASPIMGVQRSRRLRFPN